MYVRISIGRDPGPNGVGLCSNPSRGSERGFGLPCLSCGFSTRPPVVSSEFAGTADQRMVLMLAPLQEAMLEPPPEVVLVVLLS